MPTVFRKTSKGLTEIETRAHRLAPRLRNVLILVDGRRNDDTLRTLVTSQCDEALEALLAQGFIEPMPAPAAAQALPAAAAAAPAPPGEALAQRRREVVRALNELLGPGAESLALRIERARGAAEMLPLLAQATQSIATVRGAAAAEQFAARFSGPAG